MLPKALLTPSPRGGAKRREQAAQFTRRRCEHWLGGERSELWPPQAGRRRRCPPDEEPELRQARCMRLAAEGELSRACAALVAPPMLSDDDGVHSALRASPRPPRQA